MGGPVPFSARWFAALAVMQAGLLVWLWWHRLPHYGADAIQLRQPAIELVNHGRYLLPTVFGVVPHAETFFAAYPPGYTLLNALAMVMGGTSLSSYLLVDLSIHGTVCFALAASMWRAGVSVPVVAGFLVVALAAVLPIGRPEELGVALLLGAVALTAQRRLPVRLLAALPAGFALASGPMTGVVVLLFVTVFVAERNGVSRRTVISAAVIAAGAGVVVSVMWGALIWGHWREFLEQFAAFRKASYLPDAVGVARDAPGLCLLVVVALAGVVWLAPRRSTSAVWPALLRTARWVLPAALLLNLVARRPHYDYRLLALVGTAGFAMAAASAPRRGLSRGLVFAGLGVILLGGLVQSIPLVRFALAPLGAPRSAPTYEDVIAKAEAVIPVGATVGGDGAFLALNARQATYADLNISREDVWPEFVVSSTWAEPPYAQQREKWRVRLASEYSEVPGFEPYVPGCGLRLGPLTLPLARGSCEWNVRVWRKKAP